MGFIERLPLNIGGSTNLAEAILLAHKEIRSKIARRSIVIITDGIPDNRTSAIQAAHSARDEGIEIIAIGTDDADLEFLRLLVTNKKYALYTKSNNLDSIITSAVAFLPVPDKKNKSIL